MIKPCKYCGSVKHFPFQCFKRTRKTSVLKSHKPLRRISKSTLQKKKEVEALWYKLNPPDESGLWPCYLRIAPDCYLFVNRRTINLEHKMSRAHHPELKFDVNNLEAACQPCNKLKGSKDYTDFIVHPK